MAVYNEILIGRWNRFIQKLTGIKGKPPASQLAGEIIFSHPFFHGAENRFLEQWQRYGLANSTAAVAAQFGQARFRNPKASNVVAVFERIFCGNFNVDQPGLTVYAQAADMATVLTTAAPRLDPRGQPVSSLVISKQTSAVQQTFSFQGFFAAQTGFEFIANDLAEIPLLPGDSLEITGNVLNQAFFFSAIWRERFLEEGERF